MERLPGFRDFYPEPLPPAEGWSCDLRQHIFRCWRETARRYGFREYDGPPLEPLELYTNKSGPEIVAQLFNFTDKGGREVSLRPEMTPTVARMVARAERAYRKPVRWFSVPQLFRYEKQQKGRLREHFQLNCDLFGEADGAADAEMVALLVDVLRAFGLTAGDFVVRLSSRQAWQRFFLARGGDPEHAGEFYQIVDKLEREPEAQSAGRLERLGIPLLAVREFIAAGVPEPELQAMLENLDARGLGEFVRVDYGVIRGLAYYTGVVFEAFDRKGEFRAIAGGGRYDQLVGQVSNGRVRMPALGFGMGDVVLAELIKARGLAPGFSEAAQIFVVISEESLRGPSLGLVQRLREAGRSVDFSLTPAKGDKQFRRALESGVEITVQLEADANGDVRARIRDLRRRTERSVPALEVVAALS
ncbi:MAG: ATP phosphoribosyltransferase regulatory subunit [Verrucomicrobiae bacterium]|nr:ATP phosphoribosyltransferase regulatory subunit [Verrucomicrobiae bacterium]